MEASSVLNVPHFVEVTATLLFALAILHTFSASWIHGQANRYPEGSVTENVLRLLGEVEIVFGLWAGLFAVFLAVALSPIDAVRYLETRNYTEPLFVFVIMTMCATRPILNLVEQVMTGFTSVGANLANLFGFRISRDLIEFMIIMVIGPLLGSLITEPAAMTVCAFLLLRRFFSRTDDVALKHAMLGLLFVNISIGGTLTSFAAPPVLMVASAWGWTSEWMFLNFGWKAMIACVLSTGLVTFRFRRSLQSLKTASEIGSTVRATPWWLTLLHILFVALVVLTAHHPVVFIGLFLFFVGVTTATREFQDSLKMKESLLVAFFLGGLVVLGGLQGWWLEPILAKLESLPLFLGAAGLTALTDNAALTYLGSLVPNLSEASKYALVAGAVAGGGLTVIANAPNPAGYGILSPAFGERGIQPLKLFVAAMVPTIIASLCYLLL